MFQNDSSLLHELFESAAAAAPEREALIEGGTRLTRGELARRAGLLAAHLRALGVGPEVPVGICSRRSVEMVAAMLAVLKAGGAYLPLDPRYPRERLRFMLEDAGAPLVLTDAASQDALPETGARRLLLDADGPAWQGPEARGTAAPAASGDNLAYLIYTSGSTGRPKGVAIPHRAAVLLMEWARGLFAPADLDGVLASTSICFDLSVFEIFAPLSWGGRVILADGALDLPALPAAAEVTLVNTVPSAAAELARSRGLPPAVRVVNLAGEALQRALADQLYGLLPELRVYNLYGPSEDTTYSTGALVPRTGSAPPTIGAPLPGKRAYVVRPGSAAEPATNPAANPAVSEGELLVGGPGLARGYLGRPDLTAERFVPDPFGGEPGARLYRTGDLVRTRPDGELDFLGRLDHQVKIRGFRIELGEVEAGLLAHPAVRECVVVARAEESGPNGPSGPSGPRLVAYWVADPQGAPARATELRRHLGLRLPEHMIPAAFVELPALPLTPNGKVDRRALPAPGRMRPDLATPFWAPRDAREERLAELWAEALGLDAVGVEDDFFELGGHSLLAGRLLARLHREAGIEAGLRDLLAAPSVAAFTARLERPGEGPEPPPPVLPWRGEGAPPLSFAQQRLWLAHRMEAVPISYNVALTGDLDGDLDTETLRRGLSEIARRHEPLRTVFALRGGEEVQEILPPAEVPVPEIDLRALPGAAREAEAGRLAWEESRLPFDLERGPVLRLRLLRLQERRHRLLFTVHHAAWDDGSSAVLLRELPALYGAFRQGLASPLPPLPPIPLRYADFAVWQRERLAGSGLDRLLEHWLRRLAAAPPAPELPFDRPRPAAGSGRGAVWRFVLPAAPAAALREIGRRRGATLFMTALALYQALLARLTGEDDVVVASPIANRGRPELEELIGFFVNTLLLRADLGGDPSFAELLARVRETALEDFEHQDLPFELLVRALHPARAPGQMPLLRVVFSLFRAPEPVALAPGLTLDWRETDNGTAKADLTLFLEDRGGSLAGALEYAADLFDETTAARFAEALGILLAGVAAAPERRLSGLPLLGEAQRAQILVEWNDTRTDFPRQVCVHELFAAHAARRPDAVAAEMGEVRLTYQELDRDAERLARHLRALGVGPEVRVGVCLERSLDLIVSLLAVLKAGGAYVPLDPGHPSERLAFMLADSGAAALITRTALLDRFPDRFTSLPPVWRIDGPEAAGEPPVAIPAIGATAENLAYVLYTSGSTGTPKGVAIAHRAVVRLLVATNIYDFGPDERYAHVANISFDAAVPEVWGPLVHGGRVVVIERGQALAPEEMEREIRDRGITSILLSTPVFHQVAASRPQAFAPLRNFIFGGEAAEPRRVREVLEAGPPERLINAYGPTESTTMATFQLVTAVPDGAAGVPIGRPLSNTRVYVLDRRQMPLPAGAAGELCIAGEGLARGYLGRPELTAERFLPDAWGGEPGGRLYRSGDRVRQRPDGAFEFLGRTDHQVKIRGIRIELGEIEAALVEHPEVRDAVVLAREIAGDRRLVAWVVPAAPPARPDLWLARLRERLRERLPEAMVPSAITLLDALPLTPHGKVDRRALPAPDLAAGSERAEYVPPRSPFEDALAEIWSEVLGLERIGVHDDFFHLGGHSLLATQVLSRVRDLLGVDLPLRALFESPTVERLAERLSSESRRQPVPPLRPVPHGDEAPLSYAQQRLWFLDRLQPGLAVYNIPAAIDIEGEIAAAVLEAALDRIRRRHEALRTTFREAGGEPVQAIAVFATPLPLPRVDLAALPPAAREREAERLGREQARRPFDLERGPLNRQLLLRLSAAEHRLVLVLHHIVADGWSMEVLQRELAALYQGLAAGRPPALPRLPVQYADYALWQRRWLCGAALEELLAYWRQRLAAAPPPLELPADRPRPALPSFRGALLPLALPAALSLRAGELARGRRATLFMVLLAGFQALVRRYTGQDDVAVGTAIAGRAHVEIEQLIGFFVNTLVLRTDLGGDPPFLDLLERVREGTVGAYQHQDLPFEKLVEELRPERSLGHNPFFQLFFALQNVPPALAAPAAPEDEERVCFATRVLDSGTAKFDLSLLLWETPAGITGMVEYSTDLFDAPTVARLAGHLEALLAAWAADPGRPLLDLPLLAAAERHQLLAEWNETGWNGTAALPEAGGGERLHDRFEAAARRHPGAVAVAGAGDVLTYAELDRLAETWAGFLRRRGIGPEVPVGVCLERSPFLVAALLAVLKAGGAYLPLDPAYPPARLRFMLEDSRAPLVLTASVLAERLAAALPAPGPALVRLDEPLPEEGGEARLPPPAADAGNLAYLIYTSGSTGRPKGVAIEHRSAVALARWAEEVFGAEELDGVLAATSVGFDLSVFEIFVPLGRGGRVVVVRDVLALRELPPEAGVRLVNTVPSALAELLAAGDFPGSVRTVNLAGEPLPRALVEQIYAGTSAERVFNLYGPSEDTTYSTWARIDRGGAGAPPIGRPVAGTRALVLDPGLRLAPAGVPGELFLGGAGLARGYLARPDLTAERFVPDALGGEPGARLYRTGDLVRLRPDGNLEYLGRLDHQVKIRGFRIELGEVEAALLAQPGVREAVAMPWGEGSGRRLVAWLVAGEPALDDAALRASLRERLPDYMVPSALVVLDAFPRTPSGKVDRRALPAPEAPVRGGGSLPRTATETAVAAVWAEVLGTGRIGIHDNFFDLGGHSLLVIRVLSRLREALGVDLAPRALFEAPTVAALSALIPGEKAEEGAGEGIGGRLPPLRRLPRTGPLPLSFSQQRLWFLERLSASGGVYNLPVAYRLEGDLDAGALHGALAGIVCRHEVLRSLYLERDGEPVQEIAPPAAPPLPVVDLAALPEAAREREARRIAREEVAAPFDLARGPLFRARLLRLAARRHLVLLGMHHIVSDGWSIGVLARELSALYLAGTAGRPSPLPELPVQYGDFAAWQRAWLADGVADEQLAFWRERLEGLEVLELPTDRPRPAVQTFRGTARRRRLPPGLARRLGEIGRARGATRFMTLLAVAAALLERYTGRTDLALGTPVANRNRPEIEDLIGFFVNTLVLRLDLAGAGSFAELLGRVRETTLSAYARPDLPFERLVEALRPERRLSHSPLFQVMFTYESGDAGLPVLPGLAVSRGEIEAGAAKFDLSFGVLDAAEALEIEVEINTDLFDAATGDRIAAHFESLLAGALARPEAELGSLPLLSAAEAAQLREWNGAAFAAPPAAALHELFEAQAGRTPGATALVWNGEALTYGELDRRADGLARHLRALGVGPEVPVALCAGRSPALVTAMLAALKAGGFYVPLDPAYPADRLEYTLRDSGAAVLLTERRWLATLPETEARVVLLDDLSFEGSGERLAAAAGAGNLAYAIYTSGSTGRPKGVAIEHRSAVALVEWARGAFEPADLAAVFASTSICFDLSVFELFVPLATGGRVVLGENALALASVPAGMGVTLINTVPSAMAELARAGAVPASVRVVNLAGEPLRCALAQAVYAFPNVREVRNLYGPSEDTTYSTWASVERDGRREPTIGRPLAGTRARVLDARLREVPLGVPGELALGGAGLARGYLGRPDLTAEKFIPDPFAAEPGARLYRTGDLARWRPDGELEFLGRIDHQVKLRGFRIELGEIEAVLRAQPGVRDALAIVRDDSTREDTPGDPRLVAYVLGEPAALAAPAAPTLRERLAAKLPEYMVPAALVVLADFPLTPNGKVDRRRLPAPEVRVQAGTAAPSTEAERQVAAIWQDLLGLERIGVDDNFFDLGGHSLLLLRAHARLRQELGAELSPVELFQYPDVRSLARRLEGGAAPDGDGDGERGERGDKMRRGKDRLRERADRRRQSR